ncbi:hypothetical protein PHISP_02237 [Aspergillus sp. HF37]|nr:hypothetical protein PHISP_02237 [Aspergillus sp. HF37]
MSDANTGPENPPADDVGDLFDYDVPLDNIFRHVPGPTTTNNANTNTNTNAQKPSADGSGLGLDEEIKVTKSRAPVAKLDENRLLSQNGIPKLRRTAKSKLKFKGKGHEFSDAARLLNFYQLWLDDLYPRAKFADGLAMIEKLGHSRRLQTMRREWIDEERPGHRFEDDEPGPAREDDQRTDRPRGEAVAEVSGSGVVEGERSQNPDKDRPSTSAIPDRSIPQQQAHRGDDGQGLFLSDDEGIPQEAMEQDDPGQDVPEHDELDDLLKEQEEAAFNIT